MYIKEFHIEGLWGSKSLSWQNIREDVNIVVGINGSGKTTLLDAIYNHYSAKTKSKLYAKTFGNEIDIQKNTLIFVEKDGNILQLNDLSAGEKQLLYLLLTVFLMDEKPAILLLDEPELSLHITWQEKLIDALRHLNPVCQIITTTHSPSIFVNGWSEHLVFVDNLIK